MGREIRGKEISKESVGHQGRESVLGERGELPAESQFATMGADLAARRRFEDGKRNALEMEFNRSFEQFQRLATRKPGERGKLNVPGYRPITVDDFLFGISWAAKAMGQLKAAKAFARGTFLKSPAEQPVAEQGEPVKPRTESTPTAANTSPPVDDSSETASKDRFVGRMLRFSDPTWLFRTILEGTEGPDVMILQGRNSTDPILEYYTKIKNFDSNYLTLNTHRTLSGQYIISGSLPKYEVLLDANSPELALVIHRELAERCFATRSEEEGWRWLLQESPYAHLLFRLEDKGELK